MQKPDSAEATALANFCRCFNLFQIISSPTLVTQNTESFIDVILASNPQQVLETKVMHSSISDHDLVYAVLRLKKERPKPVYITTRSFKRYRANDFYADVSQTPWSVIDVFDDADDKLMHSIYYLIIFWMNMLPSKQLKSKGDQTLALQKRSGGS